MHACMHAGGVQIKGGGIPSQRSSRVSSVLRTPVPTATTQLLGQTGVDPPSPSAPKHQRGGKMENTWSGGSPAPAGAPQPPQPRDPPATADSDRERHPKEGSFPPPPPPPRERQSARQSTGVTQWVGFPPGPIGTSPDADVAERRGYDPVSGRAKEKGSLTPQRLPGEAEVASDLQRSEAGEAGKARQGFSRNARTRSSPSVRSTKDKKKKKI